VRVINGLVALSNISIVWVQSLRNLTTSATSSPGKAMCFNADPGGILDQFGAIGQRACPELARFALKRVRRDDEPDGVLLPHRTLDGGDAFDAVLAEIAKDADEARSQFAAALLEVSPVDHVFAVVH
jgi:hypothetical protein